MHGVMNYLGVRIPTRMWIRVFEFQDHAFFKGMATNTLNPASSCLTGNHFSGQFISTEG